MKKAISIFVACMAALSVTVALFANPAILNKQVGGKKVHDAMKNGKRVNSCVYCHTTAGIPKQKQGYLKGQPKYATLKTKPQCSGSGCHN